MLTTALAFSDWSSIYGVSVGASSRVYISGESAYKTGLGTAVGTDFHNKSGEMGDAVVVKFKIDSDKFAPAYGF